MKKKCRKIFHQQKTLQKDFCFLHLVMNADCKECEKIIRSAEKRNASLPHLTATEGMQHDVTIPTKPPPAYLFLLQTFILPPPLSTSKHAIPVHRSFQSSSIFIDSCQHSGSLSYTIFMHRRGSAERGFIKQVCPLLPSAVAVSIATLHPKT